MKSLTNKFAAFSAAAIMVSSMFTNSALNAFAYENASDEDNSSLYSALQDLGLPDDIIERALTNQIDLSDTQNRSGSCFYYSVMSNGATFTSASSTLFYDMSSVAYNGYTSGAAATSNGIAVGTSGPTYSSMTYMVVSQTYTASSPVTPYGSLCNYKFTGNPSGSLLSSTSHTGITFQLIYPGDVNQDNMLNSSDLTLLLQYIANPSANVSNAGKVAADCNGDGVVNNVDATLLSRVLAGDPTAIFW
jgi:hypothetical protein